MDYIKKFFTFHTILFSIFLLIFAFLSFFFIDRHILLWVTPLTKEYRSFFKFFSHVISPPFLLFIWISAFLFVRFSKTRRVLIFPFFEIATAQCLSVAVVRLTKVLIGRARPDIFLKKGVYGFYGFHLDHHYHSFPSGHTMAALTLATSFSLLFPRYRLYFFLTAFVFSFNRAFMAEHYLSDILGTASMGIVMATITHIIFGKIIDSKQSFIKKKKTSSFRVR